MQQTNKVILIEEIKVLLPHRYPMLLIDRVIDYDINERVTAIKNATVNEEFFQGHFPEKPIMPAVLLMEAMAQTAGVLIIKTLGGRELCKLVFFTTVENAKFRKPVVPGDQVVIKVEKGKSKMGIWKFDGKCYVGENLVAEATFSLGVVND